MSAFGGKVAPEIAAFPALSLRMAANARSAKVAFTLNLSPSSSDKTKGHLLSKGASVMTIESIIRRRAFRDGFHDGRHGCSMRRLATCKARWLYALGRIFANVAPINVQIYEQRHVSKAAVAAFAAMPARYLVL